MIGMKKGDTVLVNIPLHEQKVHAIVAKYNGQKMTISRRVSRLNGQTVYYELKEAQSEYGIPYSFAKDWLIQL